MYINNSMYISRGKGTLPIGVVYMLIKVEERERACMLV